MVSFERANFVSMPNFVLLLPLLASGTLEEFWSEWAYDEAAEFVEMFGPDQRTDQLAIPDVFGSQHRSAAFSGMPETQGSSNFPPLALSGMPGVFGSQHHSTLDSANTNFSSDYELPFDNLLTEDVNPRKRPKVQPSAVARGSYRVWPREVRPVVARRGHVSNAKFFEKALLGLTTEEMVQELGTDSSINAIVRVTAFRRIDVRLMDAAVNSGGRNLELTARKLTGVCPVQMRHLKMFVQFCLVNGRNVCTDRRMVPMTDGSEIEVYEMPLELWKIALAELGFDFFMKSQAQTSPKY